MGVSLKEFSSEPLSVVFWLFPGLLSLLSVTGLKSNIFLVSYHFEKTQRPSFVLLSVLLLTNPMCKKLKPVFNPLYCDYSESTAVVFKAGWDCEMRWGPCFSFTSLLSPPRRAPFINDWGRLRQIKNCNENVWIRNPTLPTTFFCLYEIIRNNTFFC